MFEPSWSYIVGDRRDADKLNHFIRWAEAITADMPRQDRMSHVRALLPKGLIGWHAVSHLEFRDHFKTQAEIDMWETRRRSWGPARKRRTREDNLALLWEITEDSRVHRLLNRWLSATHNTVEWTPRNAGVATPQFVGPTHAPTLDHPETLLDNIDEARRHRAVSCEPWVSRSVQKVSSFGKINGKWGMTHTHSYTWESEQTTRPNPEAHPEWGKALSKFLTCYEAHRDDLAGLHKALRLPQG